MEFQGIIHGGLSSSVLLWLPRICSLDLWLSLWQILFLLLLCNTFGLAGTCFLSTRCSSQDSGSAAQHQIEQQTNVCVRVQNCFHLWTISGIKIRAPRWAKNNYVNFLHIQSVVQTLVWNPVTNMNISYWWLTAGRRPLWPNPPSPAAALSPPDAHWLRPAAGHSGPCSPQRWHLNWVHVATCAAPLVCCHTRPPPGIAAQPQSGWWKELRTYTQVHGGPGVSSPHWYEPGAVALSCSGWERDRGHKQTGYYVHMMGCGPVHIYKFTF